MKPRTRSWIKRIFFALISLALLLAIATIALALLEHYALLSTHRREDLRLGPAFMLTVRSGPGGTHILNNRSIETETTLTDVKPADEARVFVVGESFAQGAPYVVTPLHLPRFGTITNWLRAILQARYPSRRIVAVNAAVGGINSFGVRDAIQLVTPLQPDVVVVITGNNENFVPEKMSRILQLWIVYRVLRKVLVGEPALSERPQYYQFNVLAERVKRAFYDNIDSMKQLAYMRRLNMLFTTLPINMKWDGRSLGLPLIYKDPDPRTDARLLEGDQLFAQRRYSEAMSAYLRSANHYFGTLRAGFCLEAMGRYGAAMELYRDLVQTHPMGRARPSFNDYLRQATTHAPPNIRLADAERAFLATDPHGMPNPKLFSDNCHMNWRGYYLVAREIAQTIVANGWIASGPGEPAAEPSMDDIIHASGWDVLYSTP